MTKEVGDLSLLLIVFLIHMPNEPIECYIYIYIYIEVFESYSANITAFFFCNQFYPTT